MQAEEARATDAQKLDRASGSKTLGSQLAKALVRLLLCARLVEPLHNSILSLKLLQRTSTSFSGRARHRSSGVATGRILPQSARKARGVRAFESS